MGNENYTRISWSDFHKDCAVLAQKIRDSKQEYRALIVLSRGGFIPAGLLSYELDIRISEVICISTYSDTNRKHEEVKLLREASLSNYGLGDKCLIIDDLADTGETIKFIKAIVPNASVACVYTKPKGKPLCDFWVKEMEQDVWIYFPWDK